MATIHDIVLIYFEDKPLVFARIENISPDVKPDWFQVSLLLLQLPLQSATWILRDVYINGEEFTMNGKKMRLEKVVAPVAPAESAGPGAGVKEVPETKKSGTAKVISLKDLKKK